MNHQDIADRFRALGQEHSAALAAEKARIAREEASLRELCGGMGHIYAKVPEVTWIYFPTGTSSPAKGRECVVCGHPEP